MSGAEDVLVSFRAGLMKPENNSLKADQRKGSVQVVQSAVDGLTHFRWHERTGPEPRHPALHDFIVFPGEAVYKKVAGAGPSARVYTLEFAADKDRTLYFWMQEPKAENDESLTSLVNRVINQQADEASEMEQDSEDEAQAVGALMQSASSAMQGAGSQGGGLSASDLARMLSGVNSSSSNAQSQRAAPVQPHQGPISAADLASVLRNIGVPAGRAGGGNEQQAAQQAAQALAQMSRASGPSLAEVLKPEVIMPLLQQEGMLEQLAPHLPEEHRTQEGLLAVATSSQWRHQLDLFSNALQTGQLDVRAFGLEFQGFSVADFLESIQKKADADSSDAEKKNKPS